MAVTFSELAQAIVLGIITGVCANLLTDLIRRKRKKGGELPEGTTPQRTRIYDFLRSAAIGGYFLVSVILINERWLVTTIDATLLITGSIIFILVFEATYLALGRYFKRMAPSPVRELIYLVVFLFMLAWGFDRSVPHYIDLECPNEVNANMIIKGRVISGNWNVRVLVHPISGADFYVQKAPLPDQTGTWQSLCIFSGSEGGVFEIVAVASPDSLHLEEGDRITSGQLPRNAYRSNICTVTKRSQN